MAVRGRAAGVRVAGGLLAAALLAGCAVAYVSFVAAQRQYLSGRNFRLLGNLARQFDTSVQAEAKVIASLAGDAEVAAMRGRPGDSRPALARRWAVLREQRYQPSDIVFENVPPSLSQPSADYDFESRPVFRVVVSLWSADGSQAVPLARLRMERILDTIFKPRIAQGAFDTIVLADESGEILYATGRRARELQSSGLTGFTPARRDAAAAPQPAADVPRLTNIADIPVGGVDYKLFLEPCCRPTAGGGQRLLLGGLVESDQFRSATWAISTTVVKVAVLGLLIALIAWPFLRVALIGERQKVRVADFFQLGSAGVAGLAIVTAALLDISAYGHMNADTDAQLRQLADDLDRHATEEVASAQAQLTCLEQRVGTRASWALVGSSLSEPGLICEGAPVNPAARHARPGDAGINPEATVAAWPYPFFETFALIDAAGMQQVKLATTTSVPSPINVAERPYFKAAASGRGWEHPSMCPAPRRCTLESVWSWTTGEPLAVLARPATPPTSPGAPRFTAAAISIPMRSLIRPVLPPGFEFAVIDAQGQVLFHSDRQRNVSENLFEETDDNRRLRAQVAAHSAEPVNIRYWGAAYRAYVRPMQLPGAYVVAMAQKQRSWAINREWLVVALLFVLAYLLLWLAVALATLLPDASWIWPDQARRSGYFRVAAMCALLVAVAALTAWRYDRNAMVLLGAALPLAAWCGTYALLRRRPPTASSSSGEPVAAYSAAALLLLVVLGAAPATLLFLASYQLHARSYIRNSQLVIARALSDRRDRLYQEYSEARGRGRESLRALIGYGDAPDLYVRFRYQTEIMHPPEGTAAAGYRAAAPAALPPAGGGPLRPDRRVDHEDTILALLEDYLPYYSEASVEWRELLHDRADDGTWLSEVHGDGTLTLAVPGGSFPVALRSQVPALTGRPPDDLAAGDHAAAAPLPGSGVRWADWILVATFGLVLLAVAAAVLRVLLKDIFLVGVTPPLWTTLRLAATAGDNVFVLCDERTKAQQVEGAMSLKLGAIAREQDVQAAWTRALIALDRGNLAGGAVVVDDFDEDLEDSALMDTKLALLEELVADPARTVVLLSRISATGLRDSLRRSGRAAAADAKTSRGTDASAAAPAERWKLLLKSFVIVEWREFEAEMTRSAAAAALPPRAPDETTSEPGSVPAPAARPWASGIAAMRMRQVQALLDSEGSSHPHVRRVCDEIARSAAVRSGAFTRGQAFDEIAERTHQCYRSIWASCSDDEKVVLGHVAEHGLANAAVRGVVRRLLGRGLLRKDPSLRLMNETFRCFVLSKDCWQQVAVLEIAGGPSTWDRLRTPLAVGVVGAGVFLFTTQKELYNAILGVTTAAAVSVPALVRAVGMLAGRNAGDADQPKA